MVANNLGWFSSDSISENKKSFKKQILLVYVGYILNLKEFD